MTRLERLEEHLRRCPPAGMEDIARPVLEVTDLRLLVAVARAAMPIAASLSGRTSTDMQTWTTCFRESDLRALVNALEKLDREED